MDCVWRNVAAWELCGNHTGLPLVHLRVMGTTLTKNNRDHTHSIVTSTITMFSLNLMHLLWPDKSCVENMMRYSRYHCSV